MTNKIDVVIDSKVVSLKSDASSEYMMRVALYVDKKISELKAKNLPASVDDRLRSVLIALNIADDYFKARDRNATFEHDNKKLTKDAARLGQDVARLEKENSELKAELAKVTLEFEEFMHNFDNEKPDEKEKVIPMTRKVIK